MTTSDMIVEVCKNMNISIAELARRINQSPQNLNKKLKLPTPVGVLNLEKSIL